MIPLNIFTTLVFYLVIALSACTAQDPAIPLAKEYSSCCGTEHVELTFEKKQLFIPNAFIPTRDKENNFFAPYINDVITDVWGFSVYSAEGDTLLYQIPYFNSKMKIEEYGWNGLRPDGSTYKGLFRYKMRIDDREANKHIVEGKACAIVCGDDAKQLQSKVSCYFPIQAGEQGKLNREKTKESVKFCL